MSAFSAAKHHVYQELLVLVGGRFIVHLCAGLGIVASLILAGAAAMRRNRAGYVLFLFDLVICVRYVCFLAFTV